MFEYILPALYLLFSFVVWKDIRTFCLLMFGITFIDSLGVFGTSPQFYYWVMFIDVMTIMFSFVLTNTLRRNVIIAVSILSCLCSLYEASSIYQTIIYPYYDYIQIAITEIILIATIWKGTRKEMYDTN